jgi:hypothetical protein
MSPVPKPKNRESEDAYIGRCIANEIDAGREQDQAAAICYSTYREGKKADERGQFLTADILERRAKARLEIDHEDFLASKWVEKCSPGKDKEKKKGIEEAFGVNRMADASSMPGLYPSVEGAEPSKKPEGLTELESVELPNSLKPRDFGTMDTPDPSAVKVPGKRLWGFDEVELPKKLKGRGYGDVPLDDDIKLKQP